MHCALRVSCKTCRVFRSVLESVKPFVASHCRNCSRSKGDAADRRKHPAVEPADPSPRSPQTPNKTKQHPVAHQYTYCPAKGGAGLFQPHGLRTKDHHLAWTRPIYTTVVGQSANSINGAVWKSKRVFNDNYRCLNRFKLNLGKN